MTGENWLIIANGEPLSESKTRALAKNKLVIALDGALSVCLNYEIIPTLCIGDFDSVDKKIVSFAKADPTIEFIHNPCQNSTDLEKALNYLVELHPETITICHATGWRLDHSLYNLRLLKRFHEQFKQLSLITEYEKVYFVKNQTLELHGAIDAPVALLSFPNARITSSGLKYDMVHYELKYGISESTSNSLATKHARIEVIGEALLLIDHDIEPMFLKLESSNY